MCDYSPNREAAMVVVRRGDDGVPTVASCCGHGRRPGRVTLKDGRELFLVPDFDTAKQLDMLIDRTVAIPLAEVWDQGFHHARYEHDCELIGELTDNPYRADPTPAPADTERVAEGGAA